jgi:hypothetical protein
LAFGWSKTASLNYENNNKFQHNKLLLLNNNLPFSLVPKGQKKKSRKKKKKKNKKRKPKMS